MKLMHGCATFTDWIDEEIQPWRQGDVSIETKLEFMHLANLSHPHGPASTKVQTSDLRDASEISVVAQEVEGVVVLTQTCDIVRSSLDRPYIEIAPLVKVDDSTIDQIRRLQRPAFAYVPGVADKNLVADLDRVMTIEKAVLARLGKRTQGCRTDAQQRDFARALSRKRSRFAFPTEFVEAADSLKNHLKAKHNKQTDEGSHLRGIKEIRVRAEPSWNHDVVRLTFWFIMDSDRLVDTPDLVSQVDHWVSLLDESGRFIVESATACFLDDITAQDYVDSDVLDLDSLSVPKIQQ